VQLSGGIANACSQVVHTDEYLDLSIMLARGRTTEPRDTRFPLLNRPSAEPISEVEELEAEEEEKRGLKYEKVRESHLPPAVSHRTEGKWLHFRPYCYPLQVAPSQAPDLGFAFRLGSEVKLIRTTLEDNGFKEAGKRGDWTVLWGSGMFRSQVYEFLSRHQKVNHFPKSHEITKKDCLFKNLWRMRTLHGAKHFGFVPTTFLVPQDSQDLSKAMDENPTALWIVKPSASSQGKGIFLTNSMANIPAGVSLVACRYIDDPMLIDGHKFDLRIYVAVTSMNPLRVYIYKEGLVRFATERYTKADLDNPFIHLTNYSVNKKNPKFKASAAGDSGSKWTLSALRQYFEAHDMDYNLLWAQIKDIAVKTVISIESLVNAAIEMHVPHRSNCFELFGFDVLLDSSLQPWLLEVNLSPSLSCDTALDLRVKTQLIADLFTLVGVRATQEPTRRARSNSQRKRPWNSSVMTVEPQSEDLSREEQAVVKETEEEYQRSEGFERLFPAADSAGYRQFFEAERPFNTLLLALIGALGRSKKAAASVARRVQGDELRRKLPPRPPDKKGAKWAGEL